MTSSRPTDWSFARRPFWLFSHVFAATVIVSFVLLGLWQLTRHNERADRNEEIEARSAAPALELPAGLDESVPSVDTFDYQLVTATGSYVDGAVVNVGNRSQGGVAGEHVVGLFQLSDGRQLLVNRGFVPLDDSVPTEAAPTGTVTVEGWLRLTVTKGFFGAADTGAGDVVPRFDVDAIRARLPDGGDAVVADLWLQLDGEPGSFPDPVPLPSIDAGPHLSYMAQWFIFAVLGMLFYGALLRRVARGRHRQADIG